MPLQLKVSLKGKEATYTRTESPMLENLMDALKVQRQETEMYGNPKLGPTDAQNDRRIKLLADFAARFWGNGLTPDDILKGCASIDGLNQIEEGVAATLGLTVNYGDEDKPEVKGKTPKK
ncbi:phage tail assembly chaperone G [Limosilactobacillus caecicola]|uniref:phage tail assembly chaperone G n=1 Tax=Limosilactobacillus caecicola TaxID=2941332 RepID=UPI002041FA4C|nr:glutamyl-tRNA synthetase [Limosilactobacillus caecicola]